MGTRRRSNSATKAIGVLFKGYSPGVKTNRDDIVYDFNIETLEARIREFIEDYNSEVDRYKRKGKRSRPRCSSSILAS